MCVCIVAVIIILPFHTASFCVNKIQPLAKGDPNCLDACLGMEKRGFFFFFNLLLLETASQLQIDGSANTSGLPSTSQ